MAQSCGGTLGKDTNIAPLLYDILISPLKASLTTRKFTSPVETLIVDPKATEDTGNTDKVFTITRVCLKYISGLGLCFKRMPFFHKKLGDAEMHPKKFYLSLLQLSKQVKSQNSSFAHHNAAHPSITNLHHVPPIQHS